MVTAVGKLATSVAAKFGLCTRKAAIRLATETGYKLVDESTRLGRNLTASEIEDVFAATLPKKLRPKILGSRNEIEKMLKDIGYSPERAHATAHNPLMIGGCIPAGSGKQPIFVEMKKLDHLTNDSLLAHELEHALERNNRFKGIFARRIGYPLCSIKTLLNKNYIDNLVRLNGRVENLQEYGLQIKNKTFLTETNKALSCNSTTDGIIELNGLTKEQYFARLRSAIRNVANGETKGSHNNKTFKLIKGTLDMEIPAYTVGGRVQEYAYKLTEGQIGAQTGTSIVYKDALKLVKGERRLYLKNKLLGKLRKPSIYQSDKDLLRLANTKEDKILVRNMIKNMSADQKEGLFIALRQNPNALNNVKAFREATKVDGTYIYDECLSLIHNINPEMLKNSDFMKIAKILDHGRPAYVYELEQISKASPERIRQFAELADKRIPIKDGAEVLQYEFLAHCINSPQFDTLKKLINIKVGNRYPYIHLPNGMNKFMTAEQSEIALKNAIEASKRGESIERQISEQIDKIIEEKEKIKFSKTNIPSNLNVFEKLM